MGKISVKKVISDVRDAYVDLTGDTDAITYGNISTKISEIQTGGGNIGYQITFKVDGNDYYVSQCLQGESITEPPTPSKSGYTFIAWQLSDNNISFPYTPSGDVELSAFFKSVRTEMEITEANTVLWETQAYGTATKTNNGTAICGGATQHGTYGDYPCFMLVGKTQNDIAVTFSYSGTVDTRQITYNGEAYYCLGYQMGNTAYTSINSVFTNNNVGTWSSWNNAIYEKVLDRYFKND